MVHLCSHWQIIARDTHLKVLLIFFFSGGGRREIFHEIFDLLHRVKGSQLVFSFFPFSAFISFQLFEARVTRLHSTVSIRALMYLPFKYCQKTFFSFSYSVRRGWGRGRQNVGFRTATKKTSPRIANKNKKNTVYETKQVRKACFSIFF